MTTKGREAELQAQLAERDGELEQLRVDLAEERACTGFAEAAAKTNHLHKEAAEAKCARLRGALETIAGFAPGNGDVCEIIARRARQALSDQPSKVAEAGRIVQCPGCGWGFPLKDDLAAAAREEQGDG